MGRTIGSLAAVVAMAGMLALEFRRASSTGTHTANCAG